MYRQPKGLYLLFSTELWERFGFYTVQAILILYLTKSLGYADDQANLLYATYSALLYLTPIIGGYLADRYFGFQQAVIVGGILSAVGYFVTVLPHHTLFFVGLSILMCANGLFKPNISSMVGELYSVDDPRREGGFTLFYMGINIGALVPPLIAEALANHYGWKSGFLLAAAGMVVALIVFLLGRQRLQFAGKIPSKSPLLHSGIRKWTFQILFYVGFMVAVGLCFLAFQFPHTTTLIIEISAFLTLLAVLFFVIKEEKASRQKMLASLILIMISVGFWALYNQTFTSLTLFADRNMVPTILGWSVNASTMQFFNPLFIIIFSPILSVFWVALGKRRVNPSFAGKFAFGVSLLALGFLLLPIGTHFFAHDGLVSPWWLVVSYLLQTLGELLLSPVGLAMITVLTPKHLVGMMMGVWFFSIAASFSIASSLANLAATPEHAGALITLPIYTHAFIIFGVLSLGLAVVSFLLLPVVGRLIRKYES